MATLIMTGHQATAAIAQAARVTDIATATQQRAAARMLHILLAEGFTRRMVSKQAV